MSSDDIRLVITVGLPCLVVLVGMLNTNARMTDLRVAMDRRFDDLTRVMEARFQIQDEKLFRVEQVLDGRLRHLEERER